jgi:hypothetical protein
MSISLGNVVTSKYGNVNSIAWLNIKIKNYIEKIYLPFGYRYGISVDLNINDFIINSEYINKMVNNYTIFKKIIEVNKIETESDFYQYMLDNLSEIYHWEGKYFDTLTLPILINTTRKGNEGERKCLEYFKELLAERGINSSIESPTIDEDVSGIDAKFKWNNKFVTIQVKPYVEASITKTSKIIRVKSQGSLSLNTDYLILYKDNNIIVVKGKEVEIQGNFFTFNEISVVGKNY